MPRGTFASRRRAGGVWRERPRIDAKALRRKALAKTAKPETRENPGRLGNVRGTYGGRAYRSLLEVRCAAELDALKGLGFVRSWTPQFRCELIVPGLPGTTTRVGSYTPDFVVVTADERTLYVEAKGYWTNEARFRVKVFAATFLEQRRLDAPAELVYFGTDPKLRGLRLRPLYDAVTSAPGRV